MKYNVLFLLLIIPIQSIFSQGLDGFNSSIAGGDINQDVFSDNNKFAVNSNNQWRLNTIIHYKGVNDFEWWLDEREINYSWDAFGNPTTTIIYDFNEIKKEWINKRLISKSYYNNTFEKEHIEIVWNKLTKEWSDTITYYLKNENGDLIRSYNKDWDYWNNNFNWGYYTNYYYNSMNKVTHSVSMRWDLTANNWENLSKYIYTYDYNNNLINETYQQWNKDLKIWEDRTQDINYYDIENQIIEKLQIVWDLDSLKWINNYKCYYSYNDHLLSSYIYLHLNPMTLCWECYVKRQYFYYYDADGNLIREVQQYGYNNENDWQNDNQYIYSFNSDGNLTQKLQQVWGGYDYDWLNYYQDTIIYNAQGQKTEILKRYIYYNTNEWTTFYKTLFKYDSNGNLSEEYEQSWYRYLNRWSNMWYKVYEWNEINVNDKNGQGVRIFPNPANEKITIFGLLNNAELEIYNISGKLMKKIGFSNYLEMDVTDIPHGIYIFKIKSDQGIFSKKVIIAGKL